MADDSLRERALLVAVRIVEMSWPDRCQHHDRDCEDACERDDDVLTEVLLVADRIMDWLRPPAVRLVMHVGPVTEQH